MIATFSNRNPVRNLRCAALATFLAFGATMWAQLTIGWQWAPPASRATTVAMTAMSAAMLVIAVTVLLAAVPVGWAVAAATVRRRDRSLRRPVLLAAAGALVLIVGGRHFGNGWPGTGAHWWPHQGLVPGGIAAFSWACTLPVTSYWAHPSALASFPPAELAWMVLSPAAMICLVTGTAQLIRRVGLSPRALRYEAWVGGAMAAGMAAFLSGALCWVAEGAPGPHDLFHTGIIDVAGLAVMAAALLTGWQALRRAWTVAAPAGAGPRR